MQIKDREPEHPAKDDVCLSRTNEVGRFTGGRRQCSLEGCSGVRYGVRWPSGRLVNGHLVGGLTFPCSKGVKFIKASTWKIV